MVYIHGATKAKTRRQAPPAPQPAPAPEPAPIHENKIREVETHIQRIRESRKEWAARLEELNREIEQEDAIFKQLTAKQTITERRLEQRTQHHKEAYKLVQQIRAKYQDPPGEGRRRMAIILREEDAWRAQRALAS
jgi:septal ring factor EnvC (AmiA/AmiB activator)